jgi:phosphoribosyl 1,2-cyclic phosphodiesterase
MDVWGELKVRFWGVRGSYPTVGTDVVRYGGNTACVEIEANDSTVILDAGTGIIPLGRRLVQRAREQGKKATLLLLFSHLHHDHTQGFPFFTPAFIPGTRMVVCGPELLGIGPQAALEEIMRPPFFPVRFSDLGADINFHVLRDTDVLLVSQGEVSVIQSGSVPAGDDGLCIRALRSFAHPGGVMHYRFDWRGRSVVYATDTEGYVSGDRRLAHFAHGTDLLIHDAQYTDDHYLGLVPGLSVTQGFGHSTISMACQAAVSAEAKNLLLFHHAPEYSDDQIDRIGEKAREYFPNSAVAYEGLEICLTQGEKDNWQLSDLCKNTASKEKRLLG